MASEATGTTAIPAPAEAQPAESSSTSAQPLSKNAQKKLARAAATAEHKKERRKAEKERRKEKKRVMAQKRAAGELDDDDNEGERKRQRTGDHKGPRRPFKARVVVDLGFDDMMTENEIKSLTSQLTFTYSANRKAVRPFTSLLFTSLNGRTLTRLEGTNSAAYKRWVDTEWWEEGYERLWEDVKEEDRTRHKEDGDADASATGNAAVEWEQTDAQKGSGNSERRRAKRAPSSAERDTVVYLTADSTEELSDLKEGETYIIGGICDHNRYKNLCLQKSKDSNIRSARLPIGTYLKELRTRKVLTVNQTFEILLKWAETQDWEQALYAVIPKRKFNDKGPMGAKAGQESDDDNGDDEDDGELEVIDVGELEDASMKVAGGAGDAEERTTSDTVANAEVSPQ
ncbi:tRNA (guanine(9)-N1)-methyltransferase [Grifola frondosa]|uniref:tRNA (guanine(9)-N1)-methyltransferase n=1 Tax=Grifola frondosa TaxID=5627 RepID=A0A1C7M212_GRIFR|nr:tRNA (guanine(9)-N1)-methyltransferase [Grifola frondosa]